MGYGELLHKSEQRTISPAICVYIDANGLHELNNERGHEAGDLMLRFVADSLMEQFPKGSLYRVGGDEFVVFPAPAENAVGDDLPHRGVILRLLPGEKGMVVQNELAEVVQMVGDPHLPAQFGFQRLAVYHKNLFHSVHLLSNGFLSV